MDKVTYSILLCRLNLSEFKRKFCVALKRRIFSSEDKSLDSKSKILIYASLSKILHTSHSDV